MSFGNNKNDDYRIKLKGKMDENVFNQITRWDIGAVN